MPDSTTVEVRLRSEDLEDQLSDLGVTPEAILTPSSVPWFNKMGGITIELEVSDGDA